MWPETICDIHGSRYQVIVNNSVDPHPTGKLILFKDGLFAEQFVSWLCVDREYWFTVLGERLVVEKDNDFNIALAKLIINSTIQVVELPD